MSDSDETKIVTLPQRNKVTTMTFTLPFLGYSDTIESNTSSDTQKLCTLIGGDDITFNLGQTSPNHVSLTITFSRRRGIERQFIHLQGPLGELFRLPNGNSLCVTRESENRSPMWIVTIGSYE